MGYAIVLIMRKTFEGSDTFEGRVAYARKVATLTKDLMDLPEGGKYYEDFDEEYDNVFIRFADYFSLRVLQNMMVLESVDKWWTFMGNDHLSESTRSVFQKFIDRIQPEDCWIGTDYATDQICDVEVGFEEWLDDVLKMNGPIEEFDFERIFEGLKNDVWPDYLYHVKNNNLFC